MSNVDILTLALIVAVRGLVPLSLLRWPFWAALACMAADAFDSVIQDALSAHVLRGHYHTVDKAFDTYYLGFEAWIVWQRWIDPLAQRTALSLFGVRLVAFVMFEITGIRMLFLIGANVFENFYLFMAGLREIDGEYRIRSARTLLLVLIFAAIPKLLQEYVMHYRESQTWEFVKRNILLWR